MNDIFARAWNWLREQTQKLFGRNSRRTEPSAPTSNDIRRDDVTTQVTNEAAGPLGWRFRPPSKAYSLSRGQLEEVGRGLRQIPPLPQGVMLVMREMDSESASAASVAGVIAREPVMAASVLRMANSAAMGLDRQIANVSEAVAYLGFSTTKSLFLRLRVSSLIPRPRRGLGYDPDKLWTHAMAVAQAAEEIGRRAGGFDPQLALTAGLLHDIGKLAINTQPASALENLWPANPDSAESILDRERRLFGADHAFIGAALAAEWKLPTPLIEIIRLHHLPDGQPIELDPIARRALLSVYVANQLVKYRHVYCPGMEIDTVPDTVTAELGIASGPELLNDPRLQTIIDRAVLMNSGSGTADSVAA